MIVCVVNGCRVVERMEVYIAAVDVNVTGL